MQAFPSVTANVVHIVRRSQAVALHLANEPLPAQAQRPRRRRLIGIKPLKALANHAGFELGDRFSQGLLSSLRGSLVRNAAANAVRDIFHRDSSASRNRQQPLDLIA